MKYLNRIWDVYAERHCTLFLTRTIAFSEIQHGSSSHLEFSLELYL